MKGKTKRPGAALPPPPPKSGKKPLPPRRASIWSTVPPLPRTRSAPPHAPVRPTSIWNVQGGGAKSAGLRAPGATTVKSVFRGARRP